MSKGLLLFILSFWLLVLFASGARANIVCTERAGAACVRWSNGISCLRGAGLGPHTMEQWSHMCSRRQCGMRSVEQRRVLCARGRFSLFSLEQRFPLRGGRGRGVC